MQLQQVGGLAPDTHPAPGTSGTAARPRVVLDTNAVLDWLLFEDPAMQALGAALTGGHLDWVGTEATLAELAHVLARPGLARWAARVEATRSGAARWCRRVAQPPLPGAGQRLSCSDPDDQKFIDLALAQAPCRLVTRDRALLKLARRAAPRGVRVQRPGAEAEGPGMAGGVAGNGAPHGAGRAADAPRDPPGPGATMAAAAPA